MRYVRFGRFGHLAGALTLVGGVSAAVLVAGPASAADCAGAVHYVASSNTIYLTGGGSFTPTDIKAACPGAPLTQVNSVTKTWLLSADLVVQDGGSLVLAGSVAGGDVNTMLLRSLASNKATEVQQITALYGTLQFDSVKVMSWDVAANGPDTNATLSGNAATTDRGRAFIRAVSYLGSDGKAKQSQLNIIDSQLSYLGYFGAEAYGVSYKARGCGRDDRALCKKVKVTGQQLNSTFDRNYMGTYTWGANGITFRGNTYSNNIAYGLDPHDVSSNLIIDKNKFVSNGNHGLICSQLCDKLTITNNISDSNGVKKSIPAAPVGDGDEVEKEVHGFMLHRGITNSKITGNTASNNSGAGIAIFDSTKNTVSGNTLSKNLYGIRLSVGSAKNTIKDNKINNSIENGIYLFKGSDAAEYSTASGRPTSNSFKNNTISGTGGNGIRVLDADKNTFEGKSWTGLGKALLFNRAVGNVIKRVTLPAKQPITITGTASVRSTLTLQGIAKTAVVVTVDPYSKVTYKK